jgi:putative DNA primase/helicase
LTQEVRVVLKKNFQRQKRRTENTAGDTISTPGQIAAAVERLAKLATLEYEAARKAEAKSLGIRVSALDKLLAKARGVDASSPTGQGQSLQFPEPDLWPEPVTGAELCCEISETIRQHVVLSQTDADAAALWSIHSHALAVAMVTPLLGISSPTPECGKTRLLTIISALVPKPVFASNITAASLFRAVELWEPTLLIDEADSYLPHNEELRGVLNSGHTRAAAYIVRSVGEDHEPRRFRTWCPKAIALIGSLPATLESRAIKIELRRKAPGEKVADLRGDRLDQFEPLARKAARWVKDHLDALKSVDPQLPGALSGRAADNWRPLLAIADTIGGRWPERACKAAEALAARGHGGTHRTMLLADIRDIFEARGDGCESIASAELVNTLAEMDARPWPEFSRGNKITPSQVAKLLKPFGIEPRTIRTFNATPKGYKRDDFADAFARYLPPSSATPPQPKQSAVCGDFLAATSQCDVADESSPQGAESLDCCGVAAENPDPFELGEAL